MAETVLVCQNTACRRIGSAKVLTAFQACLTRGPADSPVPSSVSSRTSLSSAGGLTEDLAPDASVIDITVTGCPCLGQCGNGPMVLVLPEQIWYHRIHPDEVAAIVRHLKTGEPLRKLLYPKFHRV